LPISRRGARKESRWRLAFQGQRACGDVLGSRIGIRRHAINNVLVFSLLVRYISNCKEKSWQRTCTNQKLVVDGEELRVVSKVWAAARKCHAGVPEETPLLDDDVSIFCGVDGVLRNRPVLSDFTRAKRHRGHGGAEPPALSARFVRLDFVQELWKRTQNRPEHAAARINRARIVLRDALIWLGQ